MASQLFYKAIDMRQAKASTFTGRLCREERVERSAECGSIHAFAGVSDREQHILPGLDLDMPRSICVVEGSVCHLDRELAAVRHCVARVNRQVQDRRLELRCIDGGVPQSTSSNGFDRNRFAYRPTDQWQRFLHDMVEVDDLRL